MSIRHTEKSLNIRDNSKIKCIHKQVNIDACNSIEMYISIRTLNV